MKKLLLVFMILAFLLALTGPATAAAFSDQFDRPDGDLGTPWIEQGGDWVIHLQAALVTNASQFSLATRVGLQKNYVLTSSIVTSPTALRLSAGVTMNYKDPSNYLFCMIESTAQHNDGFMYIGRVVGGDESLLASATHVGFEPNHNAYTITVTRYGRKVRCSAAAQTIKYRLTDADVAAFGHAKGAGMRAHVADNADDGLSTWNDFNVAAA